MTDVYFLDANLCPSFSEKELFRLPETRREAVLRAPAPVASERFWAWRLLETVLPRYGGDPTKIVCDERGKPRLPEVEFNLSHSGRAIALAVSDLPVGCDLERIREGRLRAADRFSLREQAFLSALPASERSDAFFRLWTAKESYLKFSGEGIRALSCVEIDPEAWFVLRQGIRQEVFLKEYPLRGFALTVCSPQQEFSSLHMLNYSNLCEKI